MLSWTEGSLLLSAVTMLTCSLAPRLRPYRSLLWGAGALAFITALFPRPGNTLAQHLFTGSSTRPGLPVAPFAIAWWILGAWLVTGILDLVLRRTIFPHDDQPHARRLFADLASGLVYVLAFVGIMDTVFKQPVSAVLATSGVLAIVLGLALQNTLADVFSGLALNIERPFSAGDWITVANLAEGQVIEINWRATRVRTSSNDLSVIPNSVVAKAVVENHRRLKSPHVCAVSIMVTHRISATRVVDALMEALQGTSGIASTFSPTAYACEFHGELVRYEVSFGVDDFALVPAVQSQAVSHIAETLRSQGIAIGPPATEIHISCDGEAAARSGDLLATGGVAVPDLTHWPTPRGTLPDGRPVPLSRRGAPDGSDPASPV